MHHLLDTKEELCSHKKVVWKKKFSFVLSEILFFVTVLFSIGSKSLNLRKKAGVNSTTYFFDLNDLKETLGTFLRLYHWTFQKSSLFVEITAYFIFQLILWCDIIKFLNRKPEKWKSLAWYHIVGIQKLWFSSKLFDLSSRSLEITVV